MVKLIRLNTSNNDAHFKASFDTDITINENSKIALKNLTFESDFVTFEPNSDNSFTNFFGNGLVLNDFSHQNIEPKTYTRTNLEEFENEVNQAFNRTINLQDGKTNSRGHAELYGQFRLSKNNQNKYALEFRQSNPMNILEGAYNQADFAMKNPYEVVKGPFEGLQFPNNKVESDPDNDELKLTTGTDSVADERYTFIARNGLGISKSAGVFYCRIKSSAVNGTNATHNGFSIGLSFGNPRRPDTTSSAIGAIDDKVRNCEIIYQDPNTNYFVRESDKDVASSATDTGVAPHLVNGGALNAHDIIMFKIDNNPNNVKVISAHIYTSAGGSTENVIFSHTLSNEELNGVITPYIYIRGADDKVVLDMLRFTPDPFYEINNLNVIIDTDDGMPDDPVAISQADATHEFADQYSGVVTVPPTQAMRTTIAIYYPTNDGNRIFSDVVIHPSLGIGGGLAEVLGFNRFGDTSENLNGPLSNPPLVYNHNFNHNGQEINGYGFRIDAVNESLFDRQDSYIVESMTLPLLSYNSSVDRTNTTPRRAIQTMGSRKNILATIPQNADTGLCQYEPNEIVYIDIKNDNKLNIRNLELRVLDNNFQPIRIVGEADMTLLIDN